MMTVFRQLGDPLAGAVCLCQHHGAAYAEKTDMTQSNTRSVKNTPTGNGVTLVSAPITITEKCCVVVNAATIVGSADLPTELEIERPKGTIRTTQEDEILTNDLKLLHHAAWEVLDPGSYTYYLVVRTGNVVAVYGAWMKIVASDCEG